MHKYIVANYKMNGDARFFKSATKKMNTVKAKDTKIILCPPFVYLPNIKTKSFELGSQNISFVENNKNTGEISAKMLNEFNVKYSIIGHSERRKIGETDDMVALKVKNAIDNNIVPIVCVGEEKKSSGLHLVIEQVQSAIKFCKTQDLLIFAYEPVWAIGTGEVPTSKKIDSVIKKIKKVLIDNNLTPICLYGGSVNEKNFKELNTDMVDGFLLGGVSLKTDKLIEIIKGVDNV